MMREIKRSHDSHGSARGVRERESLPRYERGARGTCQIWSRARFHGGAMSLCPCFGDSTQMTADEMELERLRSEVAALRSENESLKSKNADDF